MTDRQIFQDNLNYYLSFYNKKQKDLADYVGAKTTTVSGWTRGISYPRADAMEKIAMFFGIQTSQLVGPRDPVPSQDGNIDQPKNDEIRFLIRGLNKMTPEQIEQATSMMRIMFAKYFKEDDDAT